MKCPNPNCTGEIPEGATLCPVCGQTAASLEIPEDPTNPELRAEVLLLGRFRLTRRLGRGGMGDVWRAHDTTLAEDVAIKVLKPELMDDARALDDLTREVALTRKLRHPNIVGVYELHRHGPLAFITLEYIAGQSLKAALDARRGPFTLEEVLPWAHEIAAALDSAHEQRVLHRDIKPGNILLTEGGHAKLVDFGIARVAKDTETRITGRATTGTLLYMSPEQLMGEPLDRRSDLYSFAATLYELLHGDPPFFTGDVSQQILLKAPKPIEALPDYANKALLQALAKSPEDRGNTCTALHRLLSGEQRRGEESEDARPRDPGGATRQPGETRTVDLGSGVSLDLVWIAPGSFLMGSPAGEEGRDDREGPQHRVTLSEGFWLGKYEVTQAQWEAVMGNNPSYFKGSKNPVEQVSWEDCQTFIQKLNSRTGQSFRLPTEAEWEYACRAGTTTPFYTGETISTAQANYDGNYTYGNGSKGEYREKTMPVGSFPPNPWGLYDMHGNVYEWCQDFYGDYPSGSVADPAGPSSGSSRVLRGGCWFSFPWFCRSAFRCWFTPGFRDFFLGFRLAR